MARLASFASLPPRRAWRVRSRLAVSLAVVLRHHIVGDHPSAFADVELMRPAAGVGVLLPDRLPAIGVEQAVSEFVNLGREKPSCSRNAVRRLSVTGPLPTKRVSPSISMMSFLARHAKSTM